MTRANAIKEKLAYAFTRWSELSTQISDFHKSGNDIAFLGTKVGEILSACRECLDYCAKDLVDLSAPTYTGRAYFPLSADSLLQKPWSILKTQDAATFALLEALVMRIEGNAAYPGTMFKLGVLAENNKLVNGKKHDTLTATRTRPNSATLVTHAEGAVIEISPIFDTFDPDWGAEIDASQWETLDPSVAIDYVPDFRLGANNWEVRRFCDHVIGTTWRALAEIYTAKFGERHSSFDPREILLSPAELEQKRLFERAGPIVSRLVLVGFRRGGATIAHFAFDFEGGPREDQPHDAKIESEMVAVFNTYAWPVLAARRFAEFLTAERLARLEAEGFTPRYCELPVPLSGEKSLKLSDATEIRFDQITFGIGTQFRYAGPYVPPHFSPETQALVGYLFG